MSPWPLLGAAAFAAFLVTLYALAYWQGMGDGFRKGYRKAWNRRGEHDLRNAERVAADAFTAVLERWHHEVFPDDDGPPERPEVTN